MRRYKYGNNGSKSGKVNFPRIIFVLIILGILAVLAVMARGIFDYFGRQYLMVTHPIQFEDLVEEYAEENGVDKYLIYAIIKTESSFNPSAVSEAGARGLMQLMEDSYDWVKYRLDDTESADYDDMFRKDVNIKYGSYLIGYLLRLFGDQTCAISAYHAGAGNVEAWLENKEYSKDGKTLSTIPIADTAHYVEKINTAYQNYINLYGGNKNGD